MVLLFTKALILYIIEISLIKRKDKMKISIIDNSHNGSILVRRVSWKQRCEEQLTKINNKIQTMIKELKEV